jgi:adenosylcobinamide kinase/adenosylcobinamide-phosphate guanylyltransferase
MDPTHHNPVTLVLGGVRSGKSHYAQQMGEAAGRVVFVATALANDEEMRRKVEAHQKSRPSVWRTVEEPLQLAEVIALYGTGCDLMIIDCLTIYSANLLERHGNESEGVIPGCVAALCQALENAPCPVVLVSNEVGSGVVPAYPSGRRFRDLLGELNQRVARVADNVLLMVAGLPLILKGHAQLEAVR